MRRLSTKTLFALSSTLFLFGPLAWAGPVEFGLGEFNRAVAERGLAPLTIKTEVTGGQPESYSITTDKITGGDARGLMYGLLEAAEQIEKNGKIVPGKGRPATSMRGIRTYMHNEAMESKWYFSEKYWDDYFSMLARNRFNRFNLVFAASTRYLAPPYPFWVELPEFPEVQVPGLSTEQRQKNLDMLCHISRAAADHGVNFTLGIWQQNVMEGMKPSVEGITDRNIGPYTYAALKKVLQRCSSIYSVQVRTNFESGVPAEEQTTFYRDWVYRALRDAGRPVSLDLRGWIMAPGMLEMAENAGVPLRVSAKYWGEFMSRPYQPLETHDRHSYLDLLKKPRSYEFYWEIWTLGSHRVLLWGDPTYIKRAVPTFALSGGKGFEIDAPLAGKGWGNTPGYWGIFASNRPENQDRQFWNWEFERYWLFYQLWGRLSYDPAASESLWMDELRRRFGDAAEAVASAYENASRVISEIVAANLSNPNFAYGPEMNPGSLIGEYKDIKAGDMRLVASANEAASNRLHRHASAKQTPRDTGKLLDDLASNVDQAVALASSKLGNANKEWRGSEPDFKVLSLLARYHARKQTAAYSLSWFYQTGSLESLSRAENDLQAALNVWKEICEITDGLYPYQMHYGGRDSDHWLHKLVYVQHDLSWIKEVKRTQERFGGYDYRFDFGAKVEEPPESRTMFGLKIKHLDSDFLSRNSLAPRFTLVHDQSVYAPDAGFGWVGSLAGLATHGIPLAPMDEVRTSNKDPRNLPKNVLFGDFIVVEQGTFRVQSGEGRFEAVQLYADGSEDREVLNASDGAVDVQFPAGKTRKVSALLLRAVDKQPSLPTQEVYAESLPRPNFIHDPLRRAQSGRQMSLSLKVTPSQDVTGIRLHYRPLNSLVKFKTIKKSGSNATFTVPGDEISGEYDFLYYFEVLNSKNTGWFQPDPAVATPYYVVEVRKSPR